MSGTGLSRNLHSGSQPSGAPNHRQAHPGRGVDLFVVDYVPAVCGGRSCASDICCSCALHSYITYGKCSRIPGAGEPSGGTRCLSEEVPRR